MSYRYDVLANVLKSISVDWSEENITYQLQRLTSDEMRKFRELFNTAEKIENDRYQDYWHYGDESGSSSQ
jgi:hypothetical protein